MAGLRGEMKATSQNALITNLQNAGGALIIHRADGSTLTVTQDMIDGNDPGTGRNITTGANGETIGLTRRGVNPGDYPGMNLTPEQAALLIQLANQAHYLAYIADSIEQLARESGGKQDIFRKLSMEFDGKSRKVQDLANLLGYDQEALSTFRDLRAQLKNTGLDPATRAYVDALSQEVQDAVLKTRSTAKDALWKETDPMEVVRLETALASHQHGGAICQEGKGKDNGKKCNQGDWDDD